MSIDNNISEVASQFISEIERRMAADIAKAEAEARQKVIDRYKNMISGDFFKSKQKPDRVVRHRASGEEVMQYKSAALEAIRKAGSDGISISQIAENMEGDIAKKQLSHALKLLLKEGALRREGDRRFAKYFVA